MTHTYNLARAATRVAYVFGGVLILGACADGTAPHPNVRADRTAVAGLVDASSAAWDVKLLPFLPDEGDFFGLRPSSEAMAISDSGTIVGSSDRSYLIPGDPYPCNGTSAFVLMKGQLIDLLPHDIDGCWWNAGAMDVNSSNAVVGWLMTSGDKRPLLWTPQGGMALLGGFDDVIDLIPRAINDAGTIVGYANSFDATHAVAWTSSGFVDINPPWATYSVALDISDNGVIVGVAEGLLVQWLTDGTIVTGGSSSPFVSATAFQVDRTPIGINASGTIAYNGFNAASVEHPYLWVTPELPATRLDAPPRIVADISDLGRIVGKTIEGVWPSVTDIPYTAIAGVATRLPTAPGFTGATPNGVNRCGTVAGIVTSRTQPPRAVVWKKHGCD